MFLKNSVIKAGNICCGALLLSISLKLFENTPLREKTMYAGNKDAAGFLFCFCFTLLFKDLLPGSGATPDD